MKRSSTVAFTLAMLAVLAVLTAGCGYNTIQTMDERVNQAQGQIEAQLQRRADLIPNLVASVRGAAQSETTILTNVTEARARATSINVTTDDLSNPEEFRKFQDAQNQLTQALGQLRTVVENYPTLQSQARFADLMTALEGSENRINTARDRYNEAVRAYNTEIRTFPSIIGAKIVYGAKPMVPFEATAAAQTAPSVDLDNIGGAPAANPANDNAPAADEPATAAAN